MEKEWYEEYGFELEVLEAGDCRAYHKVNQKFLIDDYTSPKGLCLEVIHTLYPLIYAMRINGDVRKFGAENENIHTWYCPSKVIRFRIVRFQQCNNCGKKIIDDQFFEREKKFENYSLKMRVCEECLKDF